MNATIPQGRAHTQSHPSNRQCVDRYEVPARRPRLALDFPWVPPFLREDREGEGNDDQPSREVEQILEAGPFDEHEGDNGPDDETAACPAAKSPTASPRRLSGAISAT